MNDLFVEIEGNYSEYARTLINSLRKPWFKLKKKKNNIFKKEQVNNKGSSKLFFKILSKKTYRNFNRKK